MQMYSRTIRVEHISGMKAGWRQRGGDRVDMLEREDSTSLRHCVSRIYWFITTSTLITPSLSVSLPFSLSLIVVTSSRRCLSEFLLVTSNSRARLCLRLWKSSFPARARELYFNSDSPLSTFRSCDIRAGHYCPWYWRCRPCYARTPRIDPRGIYPYLSVACVSVILYRVFFPRRNFFPFVVEIHQERMHLYCVQWRLWSLIIYMKSIALSFITVTLCHVFDWKMIWTYNWICKIFFHLAA